MSKPVSVKWPSVPGTIRDWKVIEGSAVQPGQELATCEPLSIKVLASHKGLIKRILVRRGDPVKPGADVAVIETCPHDIVQHNLCLVCGMDVSELDSGDFSSLVVSHTPSIRVQRSVAKKLAGQKVDRLVSQKKLALILDLDQTILHASTVADLESSLKPLDDVADTFHFTLGDGFSYVVKFRPHIREFLLEVTKLYEITVYTAGAMSYAKSIVKLLREEILKDYQDLATKIIPDSRIIARDNSGSSSFKDLRKVFPHDQSMVIILDDWKDVWRGSEDCLINIRRYEFYDQDAKQGFPPVPTTTRLEHERLVHAYTKDHPNIKAHAVEVKTRELRSRTEATFAKYATRAQANANSLQTFKTNALPYFDENDRAIWSFLSKFGSTAEDTDKLLTETANITDSAMNTAEIIRWDPAAVAHGQRPSPSIHGSAAKPVASVLGVSMAHLADILNILLGETHQQLKECKNPAELIAKLLATSPTTDPEPLKRVAQFILTAGRVSAKYGSMLGEDGMNLLLTIIFDTTEASKPIRSKKRVHDQIENKANTGDADEENQRNSSTGEPDVLEPPAKRRKHSDEINDGDNENGSTAHDIESQTVPEDTRVQLLVPPGSSDERTALPRFSNPLRGSPLRYFQDAVLYDEHLLYSLQIMRDTHALFYSFKKPSDTRKVLPLIKRRTLHGCTIMFTGIFRTDAAPETQHLWITAEEYGATCTRELSDDVTHVIVGMEGTDKCVEASKKPHVYLVHRDWLETSICACKRQDEAKFNLSRYSVCNSDPPMIWPVDPQQERALLEDVEHLVEEEVPEFVEDDYVPSWDDDLSGEDEDGEEKPEEEEEIREKHEERVFDAPLQQETADADVDGGIEGHVIVNQAEAEKKIPLQPDEEPIDPAVLALADEMEFD